MARPFQWCNQSNSRNQLIFYLVNKVIHSYLVFGFLIFLHAVVNAQPRSTIEFNKNWKFLLGDDSVARQPVYDDSKWRRLSLPHDWSIEGDFSKEHPATTQGGSLPTGIGWYRKTFVLPPGTQHKNIKIEFDGVYRNSEVWINGNYLGKRPYGYSSFSYDLTEYLKPAPAKNVIAVKVDNSQQPNSRWYSGSGIYRNVRLVITKKMAFDQWGTFIYSTKVEQDKASVFAESRILNANIENPTIEVRCEIYDPSGKLVSRNFAPNGPGISNDNTIYRFKMEIAQPKLWSVDKPNLYKAVFKVYLAAIQMDEWETTFGIRTFHFDTQKGFFLNDQPLKIKGVCLHHDLGALGAAVNTRAIERQLQILKAMGCNAIRTAHNPPAPELLELCDKMGFLVMVEAFDMWKKKKNKFDYFSDFEEWHKRDLEDMVLRDRNHPSVFMWSIGNEIREQFD